MFRSYAERGKDSLALISYLGELEAYIEKKFGSSVAWHKLKRYLLRL